MIRGLRTYAVSRAARQPLLDFMLNALRDQGCRIIHAGDADTAPFVITFELSTGERMGIVAYAFLATRTVTTNRPADERSFQVKYGSKASYYLRNSHSIWRDPLGLFTTLFLGISPDEGFFVAVDPAMHNPTKFFIRIEFKDRHAEEIRAQGWYAWERDRSNARMCCGRPTGLAIPASTSRGRAPRGQTLARATTLPAISMSSRHAFTP